MDMFIGGILPWPITWAPAYFSLCYGQQISVNQNQALYSLIGNLYGGDRTNFNLPNLIGRTVVGVNPSKAGYTTPGIVYGLDTVTIAAQNLPQHAHGASFNPVTSSQTVTIPAQTQVGSLTAEVTVPINVDATATKPVAGTTTYTLTGLGGGTSRTGPYTTSAPTPSTSLAAIAAPVTASSDYVAPSTAHSVTLQGLVTGGAVAIQAGGGVANPTPINNWQPSMLMNFLICLTGLYPMRP